MGGLQVVGEVLGNVSGDDVIHVTRGVVVVVELVKACGVVGWFADGVDSCWYRAATAGVSSTYSNDTSMYVCILDQYILAVAGYQRTCCGWTALLLSPRGIPVFSARAVEEFELGSRANAFPSGDLASVAC